MAFQSGGVAVFLYGGTNVSTYLKSVTMTPSREIKDLKRLGGAQMAKITDVVGTEYKIEGWFDPIPDALFGTAVLSGTPIADTFKYGPQGTANNAPKYSGNAYVADYEVSTDAEDPGSFTVTLAVDENGNTRGTWSGGA